MKKISLLFLALIVPFLGQAQIKKDYQGLLWKISGNGLEQPSYLYGTMHVSNRVAFHLSETFFEAIESADYVALETNPEFWVDELISSPLHNNLYELRYQSKYGNPLYSSFLAEEPVQQDWEYYLSQDQRLLNQLLFRYNSYDQDFEENTFIDMFIFQAGKKDGKTIVSLEDYQESFMQVLKSDQRDEDAVYITQRQADDLLGDHSGWGSLMEDAYRRGDLDLIDTLNSLLSPGKYHRLNMLDIRNVVMAEGIDSLMQTGIVFAGVGAAHLPGDMGVINLLREMGYTVEAEERVVTSTSIDRKEEIDEIIYTTPMQPFTSDDNFISAEVPGKFTKLIGTDFQEYVFADMVNGGFYTLRRVPTFGALNLHDDEFFFGRIDSMLFENIPGKILSKDTIEVSGYPALEIKNKTRIGDLQHYQIVFTPLEVLIFKVGGHKEFAESDQPLHFFESIELHKNSSDQAFSPRFGGFELVLPGDIQVEQYDGPFENPNYTYWAQSFSDGNYYGVGMRQYHDFYYFEEDAFELKYMVEKMAEERELDIDTLYVVTEGVTFPYSRFTVSNEKGLKFHGEVHLQGPKYSMLLTDAEDEAKQDAFFRSFAFTSFQYQDDFIEYQDSVFHIVMESPFDINNYESFFKRINEYKSKDDENLDFEGGTEYKLLTYTPTSEQLRMTTRTLHKFDSYEDTDEFWEDIKDGYRTVPDFITLSDSLLYSVDSTGYLCEARLITQTDTNTQRTVITKHILENGALYSLMAMSDNRGYTSEYVNRAIASFRTADDTIIGSPITERKADLFFAELDSKDSVRVFEASSSINTIEFKDVDAARMQEYVLNYKHEEFDREARLELLNELAFLDTKNHHKFLEKMFYDNRDSSAYQFEILETLLDYNTTQGVKSFNKLILDEPPFTTSTYAYSSLFNEFNDSLELAPGIFPDIITLADFDDYRGTIYSLLAELLDSGYVNGKDYKFKYKTLLLFAKVELKKQHAADEVKQTSYYSSSASSNEELEVYTLLLSPFIKKQEVKDHYRKLLSIRNKEVLANMLVLTDPFLSVPDTCWNHVAEDAKAFFTIYPYLVENNKMHLLDEEYQSRSNIAKSILLADIYQSYDTVAFIQTELVEIKPFESEVFFFMAKDDDDKLWRILYVVVEHQDELGTEHEIVKVGEQYNEDIGNLEEIIEDYVKEIKLHERDRVVKTNNFRFF